MNFTPVKFIENMKYMGLGMVGIFVVIGIIVGSVILLNKLTKEK